MRYAIDKNKQVNLKKVRLNLYAMKFDLVILMIPPFNPNLFECGLYFITPSV